MGQQLEGNGVKGFIWFFCFKWEEIPTCLHSVVKMISIHPHPVFLSFLDTQEDQIYNQGAM